MADDMEKESVQQSAGGVAVASEHQMLIDQLQSEKSQLETQLSHVSREKDSVTRDKEDLAEVLMTTKEHISSLEMRMQTMVEEKAQMEGSLAASHIDQSALEKLSHDNSDLRHQITTLQHESNKEVAKQNSKVC